MHDADRLTGAEFLAARLLAGATRAELATTAGSSVSSIDRLEYGLGSRARTRRRIWEALWEVGIRYLGPGDVRHVDGRRAITRKLTGRLHGERLRRARARLGLSIEDVSARSGLSCHAIREFELMRSLEETPSLRLYALVGTLQVAGYRFGIGSRGGRSGDATLDCWATVGL